MRKRVVVSNGGEVRLQFAVCDLDIFRDIDQNRTRATGAGNLECFCHYARQLFQRLNEKTVFGAGQR